MASKKKPVKKEEIEEVIAPVEEIVEEKEEKIEEKVEETPVVEEKIEAKPEKKEEKKKSSAKGPKYPLGSIVYIAKNTLSDLNGFNFSISQYKKETYTVEAYDEDTGVYSVRHLKLLLKLKEAVLVSPDERAHDQINRMQF